MASSHTSLEENLKCSICSEIFKDPVLLHCCHSFCRTCLDRTFNKREVKECPLCRKSYKRAALDNLDLRKACDSFVEEKKRRVSEEPQGAICLDHAEKQKMFCTEDQKLVCFQCVSQDHQNHNFTSISKAASDFRTKLQAPLKELQKNLQAQNSKKVSYDQTSKETLKSQVQQTEKQIKEEFEKLHQFLRDEEEARIAALRKEEEKERKRINEKVKEIEAVCSDISDRIKKTEDEMKGEESLFINNFRSIEERTKFTEPDLQLDSETMIDVAKHVGNLKYRVWMKMKDLCPYYPVILSQDSRIPNYELCRDFISVRRRPTVTPEKGTQTVLGSEGFTSGIHTWEVEVGNNEQWIVGVAKKTVNSVKPFCSGVSLIKGKYSWSSTAHKITKVCVTLDSVKNQVVYTDPETNTTLQTQTHRLTEKLYPCFYTSSQTPLKILPAKVSVTMASV